MRRLRTGALVVAAMIPALAEAGPRPDGLEAFRRPTEVPFPRDAPYDPRIAALGKMLFFDPRLSGAQNMSCASCHNPSFGWETPVETAVGAANVRLTRHAPTIINAAWVEPLFWDGRAGSLEEQAAGPITNPLEMNATFEQLIARLGAVDQYRGEFEDLFPGVGITQETIVRAIATYERTVVSGWAPFDRWVDGDDGAVSAAAKRGFALFTGRAQCDRCHVGWNFTDNGFHNVGVATAETEPGDAAGLPAEAFRFKTPGLRDIALRAPYMHNGSLADLEAVIRSYVRGGDPRALGRVDIEPLEIAGHEIADLIAFLESLTDAGADVPAPTLPAN